MENNFLIEYCANSFEAIKELDVDFFDHVITDPPYDEHCQSNQVSGGIHHPRGEPWSFEGKILKGGIKKVRLPFAPLEEYLFIEHLVKIARRWSIIFCTIEGVGEIKRVAKNYYVRGGVWYKPNSCGQLSGDRPANAFECIAICHKENRKQWNNHGAFAHWTCNSTRGEKDRNPNQKPLDLCLAFVLQFTDIGDTIFDPFCGSGRIGEAALLCGRKYVGWDNNRIWIEKAKKRCETANENFGYMQELDPKWLCRSTQSFNLEKKHDNSFQVTENKAKDNRT